jgi:hypothetical protein
MANRRTLRVATAALAFALSTALAAPPALAADRAVEVPGPEPSAAEPRMESGGFSHRHYYTTWREARTYWSQDTRYPTGGWLWQGRHPFFCQAEGQPHGDGKGNHTTWWALTDDDTGNRDVFVSATAFQVVEPWKPIEGLPRC